MLTDILAGIVCGLVMGTVFLGAGIIIIFTNRDIYDRLAKRLPPYITPAMVMVSLLIAVPPGWGSFGAIAGALYNWATDAAPGAGYGSSNSTFTLAIICATVLAMLPTLFIILTRRKWGWLLLVLNLFFAAIFGWLLPLLAHWR